MTCAQRWLADLPAAEALRLLGSVQLGRIVFTWHAMPAVRVVNHLLDGPDIIIRSHYGAAVVSAADTARGVVVGYEADAIDPADHLGWCVVAVGVAQLVRDPGEAARYRQALQPWVHGELDQVLRIRPQFVRGFRIAARGDGAE